MRKSSGQRNLDLQVYLQHSKRHYLLQERRGEKDCFCYNIIVDTINAYKDSKSVSQVFDI